VEPAVHPGTTLGGRYRIERELGQGGMATVYLAHDLSLDRPVALKVLHEELAAALGPERFQQEIRTAARLQHPHLLPLFESGAVAGQLWYTMPYVQGETLRQRLLREKQLPVEDALGIATQILSALEYAHRHAVIHRDIKPENILLEGDQAVLADLGIARAIGAAGADRLTQTGISVGTPAYMSPEQAAGERELDGRSDVYSMGVVLYEMLAGEPPFTGPTPQAIIARSLTESPRPLRSVRESVSPKLDRAVMKALARAPADRYRTAGELTNALVASGPAFVLDRPPTRRRPLWVIGAVTGVLGALLLGSFFRSRTGTRPTLDSSLVAVAPFDVLDPKLHLWREGLIDLLSRNLDGAGPLRTVSPTVVVRRWSGRGDQESARELGRRTGAGLALYGSLLSAGRDSVRVNATLLDVGRGSPIEEWELRDVTDRVDRLSDSLTMRVLRGLGRTRAIGSVRLAGFGSRSLPAVKAFLQGEQHLRRSAWDSALAYYERAIELDTAFAPALRRASTALGWVRTGHDSVANAYGLRAGQHNHGLPTRDSLLIAADSVFASLLEAGPLAFRADSSWGPRLQRLFAMLERLTARYPDDPEAWFIQGEAENHLGPFAGRPHQHQMQAFDRAIALDSAFAPSYIHPIEVSAADGKEAVARYLHPYLRLAGDDVKADGARLVQVLLDSTSPGAAEQRRLFRQVSDQGLFSAYLILNNMPDSAELGVSLTRYIALHPLSGPPLNTPVFVKRSLARSLMSRGHLREGLQQLPDQASGPLLAEAALFGVVPVEDVARHFKERLAEPSSLLVMAFPWWAIRGDTASLRVAQRRADSLVRWSVNAVTRSQARYAAASAAAYLDLTRRDSAQALARFLSLPAHLCPGCYLDRLTLAQLLIESKRDPEAWQILQANHPVLTLSPTPTAVLWTLLRARVAERMGEREQATHSYTWVAGMWRNADAELQPYVTEAREGLARLTGEQR
jgi:serine/threonine protein kinase/tetratricopeptide (TPR) repeat protein